MRTDLKPKCTLLGSGADPTHERIGAVVCQSVNLFDEGGAVTVGKDELQVKLASGESLTLVRSDTQE